jgi:hypothetical protein
MSARPGSFEPLEQRQLLTASPILVDQMKALLSPKLADIRHVTVVTHGGKPRGKGPQIRPGPVLGRQSLRVGAEPR